MPILITLGQTENVIVDIDDVGTNVSPIDRELQGESSMSLSGSQTKHWLDRSHLQQNPFTLLGVTTRDDRRRIVEQAEEKSLELDHDACQKARSDLTNL